MIAKSHQWQLSAIAVAALLGLWGTDASALSLGRVTVQSALGEPLKAEIDILDINAEEAATLTTKVAASETFKAAGLDYHPAMGNLQTSLQRRPDGRAFIKLSSDRAINDPFVDMILETSWSSGRIVRDYTMLFDPPGARAAGTAVPAPGQIPAPARSGATLPQIAAPDAPSAAPAKPVASVTKKPTANAPAPLKPASQPDGGQTVTVKAGDTAGRIAAANKPGDVSLDQMLVALLRANPDAFIKDNINRLKAGSVLELPTPEQAASTPATQARQIIIAQSQDFNDFRRQFATSAPLASVQSASRDVSGKVQATVQDKKPTATTADKLTLSKGAVPAKAGEDQLAQAKNARETASRAAELSKNISDLNKLAAISGAASASASATSKPALATITAAPLPASVPVAASAPVAAAPVASAPAPIASAAAPVASAPTPVASAPVALASAAASAAKPAVSAPRKPAPPAPEPLPEPGLLDDLVANPLLPIGAAALLALLAGLGIYKVRQRKKAAQVDSSLIDRPDSFLGASGGQSVDTSDNLTTGSSMVYSPSQLNAVDEVDPVAEADVYLAYGRHLQAEEILKDALRSNPERLAIHHKLLEIYVKMRDTKAFEATATQAFNLTDGSGPDWEQICEKGLSIDPDNALYLPGGQPFARPSPLTGPAPFDAASGPPTVPLAPQVDVGEKSDSASVFLDFDLDFSADEPGAGQPPAPSPVTQVAEPLPPISMDMLDLPPVPPIEPEPQPEPDLTDDTLSHSLDFSLPSPSDNELSFDDDQTTQQLPSATPKAASSANADLLEFDLGSLSLDLGDDEPVTVAGSLAPEGQDPLETKLALADEFRAIGDDDGARALIEEVIAEASGDMKAKAQRALSRL